MSRFVKKQLIGFCITYALLCLIMFALQRTILYHPQFGPDLKSPAEYGLPDFSVQKLKTADGITIEGWYHKAENGRPTFVHFHGNAGNLANRAQFFGALATQGYGVLAIDYRGYGKSEGSPSETGFYNDGRAALNYLVGEQRINFVEIVLYGESIGTGVAVQMATEYKVGAVMLQSPYTSMADIGGDRYFWLPVDLLLTDRFDSLSKITGISAPLLVMHGTEDTIIPVRHAKQLFAAAHEPKHAVYFSAKGHNDLGVEVRLSEITKFLTTIGW